MRRRSALAAAALPWLAPRPASAAAAAQPLGRATTGSFVAWGRGGLWAGRLGADLHRLGEAGAPIDAPALTAQGLWCVAQGGELQRWQLDEAWRLALRRPVADRAHAVVASDDGALALVAHGERLELLDAQGRLVKAFEGTDLARRRRGSASELLHLRQRRSFVAAWPTLGELWEIQLDPHAPPVFDGLVHDYRHGEGIAAPGYLGVRRAPLGVPMPTLAFVDAGVPWMAGLLGDELVVVHLDVRRRIAAWPLPGARPQDALLRRPLGAAPSWWVPQGAAVQTIDPLRWTLGPRLVMPGPVHRLQPLADTVIAWVGEGAAARLVARREEGSWEPFAAEAGGVRGIACDPTAARLLVAGSHAAELQALDASGRVLQRWPRPGGCDDFAWLPI